MDKKYSDFKNKLLKDMETFLMSTLSEVELNAAAEERRIEILKQIHVLRQQISFEPQEYLEMNGNIQRKDIIASDTMEDNVTEDAEPLSETSKSCLNSPGAWIEYENQDTLQAEERLGWPPAVPEEPIPLGQINPPSAPALRAIAIKCGPLQRKDRFMFMDQFRRFWVALHGRHLYFYSNDRENKPQCWLDIIDYTARHAPEATKDSKKKPLCFELLCPGNKAQQFIARTTKDMEQWVTVINRTNEKLSCSSMSNTESNSTYDDAADSQSKALLSHRGATHIRCLSDDSEDAIYHDIQDGNLPENLYDDAAGHCGTYSNFQEETYDDVGVWRERFEEIGVAAVAEESMGMSAVVADESVGVMSGIRLPAGGGRIRQLVRLMEEEGVIKGDECGRRRDEGGGGRNMDEGKDH